LSDIEIARDALATLYRRRHPSGTVPRVFSPDEMAFVIQCTQACDGDPDEKRFLHQLAVRGAFLVSRGGPPSSRFVWGRMAHFLAHVARGRADAARSESPRPRPTPETQRPAPLQANREAWAKLGEILSGLAPAMPRATEPVSSPLEDDNEKSISTQK
jgi:hypothetical protein